MIRRTAFPRRSVFPLLLFAAAACATDAGESPEATGADISPLPEGVAELVFTNGKIATLDGQDAVVSALAARDGRIAALGADDEVADWVGEGTRVIDLGGRLAIPGFIEGHGHFMGLGNAQMILDLTTADTWDDIVAMVAEAAADAEPGVWISGRGWHQEKWSRPPDPMVEGQPVHEGLSAVSPDNPVILTHASGHASFVNGKALELAGIDADTPNPPGGEIVHDAAGRPTGVLRETAQGLARRSFNEEGAARSEAEREALAREQVRLANEDLLRKGITSFQDAGSGFGTVDLLRTLADEGALPVRMYVMLQGGAEALAGRLDEYRMIGYADNRLTVRSIKQVVDGALGSHGAWLLQPYADMPSSTGLATTTPEEIERVARLAIERGYQVNTHAIGDRGNREVLDLYERTFADHPDRSDLRWRIEHAQHIDPADIPRFAGLGVIASMQGIHACSDGPWVMLRLGEGRARSGAYVWQDLMRAGAIVTNGTDVPVEDADPLASFHCTVTRLIEGGSTFFEGQAMTREEALKSYTWANAYAAFEEDLKGTLEVGKLADITVLSRDILTIAADEILQAEVDYTIVDGRVEYSREN
ncbi:amidohydrolase [Candidatus Palauibacter sp.]|uniref:amidohydrolase n=1 Tax=Candidatus Palauibacter sp. TaxID=3101350 RepID=UPI003CC5FBAC